MSTPACSSPDRAVTSPPTDPNSGPIRSLASNCAVRSAASGVTRLMGMSAALAPALRGRGPAGPPPSFNGLQTGFLRRRCRFGAVAFVFHSERATRRAHQRGTIMTHIRYALGDGFVRIFDRTGGLFLL